MYRYQIVVNKKKDDDEARESYRVEVVVDAAIGAPYEDRVLVGKALVSEFLAYHFCTVLNSVYDPVAALALVALINVLSDTVPLSEVT
jgi:hypothetical protein